MRKTTLVRIIDACLKPLRQRIMMVVGRGVLESTKDDGGIQFVKGSLLSDEVRDDLERIQNFGFSSRPPAGSEMVCVFVGGNRENGFVVGCDNRDARFKNLAEGESVMFNAGGQFVHLKADGELNKQLASVIATLSGNMEVTGQKFKFQGGSAEVLTVISDICQALTNEPWIVNKATFAALKTQIDSIKA